MNGNCNLKSLFSVIACSSCTWLQECIKSAGILTSTIWSWEPGNCPGGSAEEEDVDVVEEVEELLALGAESDGEVVAFETGGAGATLTGRGGGGGGADDIGGGEGCLYGGGGEGRGGGFGSVTMSATRLQWSPCQRSRGMGSRSIE